MYSLLSLIFLTMHKKWSFSFRISSVNVFIWSKICSLILSISFLDGFTRLVVWWFIKFPLWSFKVTKDLLAPITQSCLFYLPAWRTWYLLCWFLFPCFYLFIFFLHNLLWCFVIQSVHTGCLVFGSYCIVWCVHFFHIFTQNNLNLILYFAKL